MADPIEQPQGDGLPLAADNPPEVTAGNTGKGNSSRYDANMQLIRRRLADAERMNKNKKWWPKKP